MNPNTESKVHAAATKALKAAIASGKQGQVLFVLVLDAATSALRKADPALTEAEATTAARAVALDAWHDHYNRGVGK